MGYLQSKSFLDLCERRHAPYIRDRRASQGLLGRVAPSGGAGQGPIAGYVLQPAAPAGPSPYFRFLGAYFIVIASIPYLCVWV